MPPLFDPKVEENKTDLLQQQNRSILCELLQRDPVGTLYPMVHILLSHFLSLQVFEVPNDFQISMLQENKTRNCLRIQNK